VKSASTFSFQDQRSKTSAPKPAATAGGGVPVSIISIASRRKRHYAKMASLHLLSAESLQDWRSKPKL
jgi:hypothetical protein